MEKSDKVRILSHFFPRHEPFVILGYASSCNKHLNGRDLIYTKSNDLVLTRLLSCFLS